MTDSRTMFREVRSLLAAVWRAGRGCVVRALALALAAAAVEGAGLALLLPLLALVGIDAGPGGPGPGIPGPFGIVPTLPLVLALFVAFVAAGALLERAQGLAAARVATGFSFDLRRRLHAALSTASWPWFSRLRASDAAHVLTDEVERAAWSAEALAAAAVHGLLAFVYLGVALSVAPGLAGAAAAAGLLGVLAWHRVRGARWRGAGASLAAGELLAAVGDGMQEARTDRAHGRSAESAERMDHAARAVARSRLDLLRHLAGSRALVATGSAVVLAVFVWVCVALLGTAPAALLVSLFLLNRLLHRALAAVQQVEYAAADMPGFGAVERLMGAARAVEERRPAAGEPAALEDRIRVEGVSFSYAGPDRPPAIQDADLEFPAGSLVVLSGPSGSGKTTLLDLLAGVLAPDRGRILADGAPLGARWGARVGYVAQDALLLHGTVRENLLRGRPGASEQEIRAALALAGGVDPDRHAGERGQALSGGERRRVALARALLRAPSLLLLDGVADGLEPAEEARLLDALEGLRSRVTVVLASRGEESARRADLLVRMERGRAMPVARERAA